MTVFDDKALDRVVAEVTAAPAGEQRRAGSVVVFTESGVKRLTSTVWADSGVTRSPLAVAADVGSGVKMQILAVQAREFRDAQPGPDG